MVANKKVTGRAMSMPAGLSLGLAVSIGLTLVLSALVANLVLNGSLEENAIGYCSILILLASSALGALISAGRIKRRWLVVCLGAGGLYYLALLAITALFFGGQYQGMGVTALLVLVGSGAVGLLGLKEKKGSRRVHRKYRSR